MWNFQLFFFVIVLGKFREIVGPHVCNHNGFDAYCLLGPQFKRIYNTTEPEPYAENKQFQEIFKIIPDTTAAIYDDTSSVVKDQISTYQLNCELKYIKGPFTEGAGSPGPNIGFDKENPYYLEVTEIEVAGHRMHNWLHIKIATDPAKLEKLKAVSKSQVTGIIKYAFLVVQDGISFAVGDFNHHLPCDYDCDCQPPDCYQATADNSFPCMYANDSVVTHPGQMMMYSEKGVKEIHATWHHVQFPHRETFKRELHFKALLIESTDKIDSTVTDYATVRAYPFTSQTQKFIGIFGWSPLYTILWPTIKSLGSWDYYRRDVYDPSQIKCHTKINLDYYVEEEYGTTGLENPANITDDTYDCDKWGDTSKCKSTTKNNTSKMYLGARNYDYTLLSGQNETRLYWGPYRDSKYDVYYKSKKYLGYSPSGNKPRILKRFLGGRREPRIDFELKKYKIPRDKLFDVDRCACPVLGTYPPAEDVPPSPIQLQGRKSHAVQMIIAWLLLVPFGMFVARYYKETYSRVYFLQEFWWFSIHVLCFVAAAMFMVGGIFCLELNRRDPIRLDDRFILSHVVMGAVAMVLFFIQLGLGHQRMKDVQLRLLQIMLHWLFGFVEYIFAIAAMLLAGLILQGGLPCGAFFIICLWIVVQIAFYVFMEMHMRHVDKILKLNPPRSYLPPPVMRVFHMNAPLSNFRIYMLIIYGGLCTLVYTLIHLLIKYDGNGESCFKRVDSKEIV